jgi:hypothetical protein
MKPAPPEVLRKGALVRVSGGPEDVGAEARALAFLDLRFPDGHVERWLGPGSVGTLPQGADGMAVLQEWAAQTADEFAFDIACDVARHYAVGRPPRVDALPCEEVVIEWGAPLPSLGG